MKNKNARIKDKVKFEQVRILYKHFHFLLMGESLGAILYVCILWQHVQHGLLLAWLALNLIVNGLCRHILTYLYNKKTMNAVNTRNVDNWKNGFDFFVFLSGMVWAIGALFYNLVNDDVYKIIIVLIMIGETGAANAVFIPSVRSYLLGVIPIFVALFYSLLTDFIPMNMAIMGVLCIQLSLSIRLAFTASHGLINSLAMQHKNNELLTNIISAKNELQEIHHHLKKENEAVKLAEKSLRELATHDQLTQLGNRYLLNVRIRKALERSRMLHNRIGLLFLDLDYFKVINDTLGHDMGDKLLIHAARRMQAILTSRDTVARLGGDEFGVLLVDIEKRGDIENTAASLCAEIKRPFHIEGHELNLSASIGVCIFPDHAETMDELFKKADLALFKAKDLGRNQYVFFDEAVATTA